MYPSESPSTSNSAGFTSPPQYQYTRLPEGSIRLFKLLAYFPDTYSILGSFHLVNLGTTPTRYTTLSYTWGDSAETDTSLNVQQGSNPLPHVQLYIADDTFSANIETSADKFGPKSYLQEYLSQAPTLQIGKNLSDFLIYLYDERYATDLTKVTDFLIWIDAICINQRDDAEKISQLPLMGQIYTSAVYTFIWLGLSETGFDEFAWFFEFVVYKLISLFANGEEKDENLALQNLIRSSDIMNDTWWELVVGIQPRGDSWKDYWLHLNQFIASKVWFSRVWCVQEFCLSECVLFQCGEKRVHPSSVDFLNCPGILSAFSSTGIFADLVANPFWFPLLSFLELFQGRACVSNIQHPELYGGLEFKEECWAYPGALKFSRRHYVFTEILHIVQLCRMRNLTYPIDRVNAVLGLASYIAQEQQIFTPSQDDSRSITKLFTWFWSIFYNKCDNLLPLGYAADPSLNSYDLQLPSWCPDLTVHTSKLRLPIGSFPFYNATSLDPKFPKPPNIVENRFSCGGYAISPVVGVFSYRLEPHSMLSAMQALIKVMKETYITGCDSLEALMRTMRFNRMGLSATSVYDPPFERLVRNVADYEHLKQILNSEQSISPITAQRWKHYLEFRDNEPEFEIGWKMFLTDTGYVGMGPLSTKINDCTFLLEGGTVPYILRSVEGSNDLYSFLGECYVHGIMNGELMKGPETFNKFDPISIV